nr:MAG TPA: hypothetical protein [Caudoviricetes sp.]
MFPISNTFYSSPLLLTHRKIPTASFPVISYICVSGCPVS